MLPLLNGVRVLDLTKLFTLATGRLADLGADVIKVEEPPAGDYLRGLPPIVESAGVSLAYLMLNRNKRSIGLDLKQDEGRQLFLELVKTADVVVELSKPEAFRRLGLDYESLRDVKPDLIYCSITGYGQDGPYRDLPSHSMNVDACAGNLRIERGPAGRPEIGAYSAIGIGVEQAALHAALGIVSALLRRSRTGQGQYLDASCWDGSVASNQRFLAALNLSSSDEAIGASGCGGLGPRYNVYGTKDDRVIFLCPLEKKFWFDFCTAIDRPEWKDRGAWRERMDFGNDDPALREDIEAVMRTRRLTEWIEILGAAGVPASPVVEPDELEADPHTSARNIVATSQDPGAAGIKFVRPPLRLPGEPFSVAISPPGFGEHTEQVLAELGYGTAGRARFIDNGIVRNPRR